jgi:hypothetical protein
MGGQGALDPTAMAWAIVEGVNDVENRSWLQVDNTITANV